MSEINIQRLAKDIKNIMRDPIENIYYQHDDENILKGYALIIGPKNTPYENGYYLFEFIFPEEYPFLPPTIKYYTNDGYTRFNPNFYICGKVCLSILNTWKGEGWTSCQNIRSILIILQTTLNDTPLCNEPGIGKNHRDYNNYNNMIMYKNHDVAIVGMLNKKYLDQKFNRFFDIMIENYTNNRENIYKNINNLRDKFIDNTKQKFSIYASEYTVNFNSLFKSITEIENSINNKKLN